MPYARYCLLVSKMHVCLVITSYGWVRRVLFVRTIFYRTIYSEHVYTAELESLWIMLPIDYSCAVYMVNIYARMRTYDSISIMFVVESFVYAMSMILSICKQGSFETAVIKHMIIYVQELKSNEDAGWHSKDMVNEGFVYHWIHNYHKSQGCNGLFPSLCICMQNII